MKETQRSTVAIDVRVRGGGRVVTPDGRWCEGRCRLGVLARGARVTLRAESGDDFFAGWSVPCGPEPECVFTANHDLEIGVLFAPDRYRFEWARGLSATGCIGADSLTVGTDLVMTGLVRGTATIDAFQATSAGSNDILLAGFDMVTGRARWARRMGTARNEGHHLIGIAPDGHLVLDMSNYVDSHTVRWLDARSGREERVYSTAEPMTNAVLLPDGDVIGIPISGRIGLDPATFVRLDAAGNPRWKTSLGATQRLFVSSTLVDWPELLVVGTLQGEPTFAAGAWQGTRDPMLGSTFLARLDLRNGAMTGARWLFSQQRFESIEDVALDDQGNLLFVLFAGETTFLGQSLRSPDKTQIWIVSATGTLDHINWVQRFPTRAHLARAHLLATRETILLAGIAMDSISIGSRTIRGRWPDEATFVAALARDGRVRWAGGAILGRDYRPPALATDSAGNIYVAGKLDRDTQLGGHRVSPDGHGMCGSIYLAKLARVGRP